MCDSPIHAYLAKEPKFIYGNFMIVTKQYREYAQLNKEYLFFNEKYLPRFHHWQSVWLPCGKCIQCLNKRSKSWEIRSIFEKNNYSDNCVLTLTYNDENLPVGADFIQTENGLFKMPVDKKGVANYKDVQDFVKRIRKHFDFKKKIRYICSVEYGSSGTLRPHYHLVLFGFCPNDLKLYKKSTKGTLLYKSELMNKLWKKGFVDVGKCDIQSCRYVSQYCCKGLLKRKQCMSLSDKFILDIKNRLSRECLHASLGLGFETFKKVYSSIINAGKIVYGKFTYAIPRYFIKKLEFIDNELFKNVKNKGHTFWLNFVFDEETKRNAIARSEVLLHKLNLFHSDLIHCHSI